MSHFDKHQFENKHLFQELKSKFKRKRNGSSYYDARKKRLIAFRNAKVFNSYDLMPNKILNIEPSIRNICNIKYYTNYSTSKCLKSSKEKGYKNVRFTSPDKYLQNNVSCLLNNYKLPLSKRSLYTIPNMQAPVFHGDNNLNTVNPIIIKCKPATGKENTIEKTYVYVNGHFSKTLNSGENYPINLIKYSKTNLQLKSLSTTFENERCVLNDFDLKNTFLGLTSIEFSKEINLLRENKILTFCKNISFAILHSTSSEKQSIQKKYSNTDLAKVTGEEIVSQCFSTLPFIDTSKGDTSFKSSTAETSDRNAKVIQTLVDLCQLSSKIEKCKSILEENDYKLTDSSEEFRDICMKEKTSNLVMRFNSMLTKKNKSKPVIDENITVYNLRSKKSGGKKNVELLNIEKSFVRLKSSGAFCGKLSESEYIEMMCANNDVQESKPLKSSDKKRKCKRKKNTEKTSENTKIKRSKTLDECIQRVNDANINDLILKFAALNIYSESFQSDINENEFESIAYINDSMSLFSPSIISKHTSRTDITEEEINKILSFLPPIEETLNAPDTQERNEMDFIDPSDIIHYEISEGNFMVIFPYVDLDL